MLAPLTFFDAWLIRPAEEACTASPLAMASDRWEAST